MTPEDPRIRRLAVLLILLTTSASVSASTHPSHAGAAPRLQDVGSRPAAPRTLVLVARLFDEDALPLTGKISAALVNAEGLIVGAATTELAEGSTTIRVPLGADGAVPVAAHWWRPDAAGRIEAPLPSPDSEGVFRFGELHFPGPHICSGRVVDETGTPAPYAVVTATVRTRDRAIRGTRAAAYRAMTNAFGAFLIPSEGALTGHTVLVQAVVFQSGEPESRPGPPAPPERVVLARSDEVRTGRGATGLVLVVKRYGGLEGAVSPPWATLGEGKVCVAAWPQREGTALDVDPAYAWLDGEGRFSFRGLPAGLYDIVLSLPETPFEIDPRAQDAVIRGVTVRGAATARDPRLRAARVVARAAGPGTLTVTAERLPFDVVVLSRPGGYRARRVRVEGDCEVTLARGPEILTKVDRSAVPDGYELKVAWRPTPEAVFGDAYPGGAAWPWRRRAADGPSYTDAPGVHRWSALLVRRASADAVELAFEGTFDVQDLETPQVFKLRPPDDAMESAVAELEARAR